MGKVHVVDGEVRPCRATKRRCPKSEAHFWDKKEAVAWNEKLLEKETAVAAAYGAPRRPPGPVSKQALELPLGDLPKPAWLQEGRVQFLEDHQKDFVAPEVVGRLQVATGPALVIWDKHTRDGIEERGYNLSRVSLHDEATGRELGYLKMVFVDDESFARSFKEDEWAGARCAADFGGSCHSLFTPFRGQVERGEVPPGDRWENAKTPEERLAMKREIWAQLPALFKHTSTYQPSNYEALREKYRWGMLDHLRAEDAPEDEGLLEQDLEQLKALADDRAAAHKEGNKYPFVDYIRTDEAYRGRGLGKSLYLLGARLLARDFQKPLKASGLQSPEAVLAWRRLTETRGAPITVGYGVRSIHSSTPSTPSFLLDFTGATKLPEGEQAL